MFWQTAATAAACIGGWIDFRTRRIPNKFTVSCALAGFLLRFAMGGIDCAVQGFGGLAVGAVSLFLWRIGGIKAGDVKLYMAVGMLGGWKFCVNVEVYSILLGGVAGCILLFRRKIGTEGFRKVWLYAVNFLMYKNFTEFKGCEESYFSFGWLIGAGALAALCFPVL